MIFYFRLLTRRPHGGLWVGAILLVLLIVPWVYFLLTVEGEFEHPSVYLPVPFGMLALLWLTRRWWWESPSVILGRRTA
jgi:hypothetical protein